MRHHKRSLFAWLGWITAILALAIACGGDGSTEVGAPTAETRIVDDRPSAQRIEFLEGELARVIGLAAGYKNSLNNCERRAK